MNKRIENRQDKIKFLTGLHAGNRSVSELKGPVVTFLSFRTSKPDVVHNQTTNRFITPMEAQTLKDNANDKDLIWLEGLNDGDLEVWWKKEPYKNLNIFKTN